MLKNYLINIFKESVLFPNAGHESRGFSLEIFKTKTTKNVRSFFVKQMKVALVKAWKLVNSERLENLIISKLWKLNVASV